MDRALLVEDNEHYCELIRLIFRAEYIVDCVDTPLKAIAALDNDYLFVLLDLNFAGNTQEAMNAIPKIAKRSNVIAFTGLEDPKVEERSKQLGCIAFIKKSSVRALGIDWFSKTINNAIGKAQEKQAIVHALSLLGEIQRDFNRVFKDESTTGQPGH